MFKMNIEKERNELRHGKEWIEDDNERERETEKEWEIMKLYNLFDTYLILYIEINYKYK